MTLKKKWGKKEIIFKFLCKSVVCPDLECLFQLITSPQNKENKNKRDFNRGLNIA